MTDSGPPGPEVVAEAWADGHPDELLSALLDGELSAADATRVEEHLPGCEPCRGALDDLGAARTMLRGLPTVDASPLVSGVLARHRSLIRAGGAFVAVTGLLLVVAGVAAGTRQRHLVPAIDAMALAHEVIASSSPAEAAGVMAGMEAVDPAAGVGRHYAAPAGLIGSSVRLSRQAVFDGQDLTAVVYRDGGVVVSVFEQPGSLDWDGLPDGAVEELATTRAWVRDGEVTVLVAERGDLVVTVVSQDRGAAITALSGLPETRRRSTWDRVHDACERFTEVFAFGG